MKAYLNFILPILIIINLISNIFSSYPENYTIPYFCSIRIGSKSKEIKLLINSISSTNVLFTNSNRKYSKEISSGRKSDAFMDKIEFNGHVIPEFPFSLILDNTGLNSPEIQGEFGLGLDKDSKNDLIENLYMNQIISDRKIILKTSEDLLKNEIYTNTKSFKNELKFCNLTRKSDLDDFYSEAWICELSHLIEGESDIDEKSLESSWAKARLIFSRGVFDTRQKYIILPIKYLKTFENFWYLYKCEQIFDKSMNLKYFRCNNETYEKIKNEKPIYFIIEGYGLKFNFNDLFLTEGNYKKSLIRFTNTISNSNLFIFGIPLFQEYTIMFDYENKRIGFKGDNILDFSKFYKNWKEGETIIQINESNTISFISTNEKALMIFGAFIGSIIILYVLFFFIRENRRNDTNKIHSAFVEQAKEC